MQKKSCQLVTPTPYQKVIVQLCDELCGDIQGRCLNKMNKVPVLKRLTVWWERMVVQMGRQTVNKMISGPCKSCEEQTKK